jgi:hypothetical protein
MELHSPAPTAAPPAAATPRPSCFLMVVCLPSSALALGILRDPSGRVTLGLGALWHKCARGLFGSRGRAVHTRAGRTEPGRLYTAA